MRSRLSELEAEVLTTAHKLSQANAQTENEVSAARFEAERRWEKTLLQGLTLMQQRTFWFGQDLDFNHGFHSALACIDDPSIQFSCTMRRQQRS